MKRILSAQTLILAGAIAAALAASTAILSVVVFGRDMLPNLVAELSGVLLEIAVIVLIVERISAYQRRRDARFAYDALSKRAAMIFVDIMRLLWVRASAAQMRASGHRHDEFREVAELHLMEYRSNIEGFATSLDPPSHELLRQADRRLSWVIRLLQEKPLEAYGYLEQAELMTETAETIARFLAVGGGPEYAAAQAKASEALRSAEAEVEPGDALADDFFHKRWRAQTAYLRSFPQSEPAPPNVLSDVDNRLAFGYFTIDRAILASLTQQTPADQGHRAEPA